MPINDVLQKYKFYDYLINYRFIPVNERREKITLFISQLKKKIS